MPRPAPVTMITRSSNLTSSGEPETSVMSTLPVEALHCTVRVRVRVVRIRRTVGADHHSHYKHVGISRVLPAVTCAVLRDGIPCLQELLSPVVELEDQLARHDHQHVHCV